MKEELKSKSSPGLQQFCDELLKQLQTRFDLTIDHLAATFVDPQFKHYLFLEAETNKAVLFVESMLINSDNTNNKKSTEESQCEIQDMNYSRDSLLGSIFEKVCDAQGDSKLNKLPDISEQVKEELSLYLKHSVRDQSSDSLQFWKQSLNTFPPLAKAALFFKFALRPKCYMIRGLIRF